MEVCIAYGVHKHSVRATAIEKSDEVFDGQRCRNVAGRLNSRLISQPLQESRGLESWLVQLRLRLDFLGGLSVRKSSWR
jgi:hypothetical protein